MSATPYRRLHDDSEPDNGDRRARAQHDRDRLIYSDALSRLAGVTQVVGPGEGHLFHNRLTHTLEVAQLALRLGERMRQKHAAKLRKRGLIVEPVIAEAAALAHDLGHPPFGHAAEDELNRLVLKESGVKRRDRKTTALDGYEGNAQSFRLVTKLAAHKTEGRGLDLTRATLCAMIKYPWLHEEKKDEHKYGAYASEAHDFEWARADTPELRRSCEAQLMDHADNIAYSVGDLLDFYRAGLIPLEMIANEPTVEINDFRDRLRDLGKQDDANAVDAHAEQLTKAIIEKFPRARYADDPSQRSAVRAMSSALIHRFVVETEVTAWEEPIPRIQPSPTTRLEMKFLQRLVWKYVIENPRLATQQEGQRRIVKTLFRIWFNAIRSSEESACAIVPLQYKWQLDEIDKGDAPACARFAADIVSSLTDLQAPKLFQRMTGISAGSVMDMLEA